MQEAYKNADTISEEVRKKEQEEAKKIQSELEDTLRIL